MRWNWPQPDWANITYDAARPALSANELLQAAIGDEGRAADFEGLDLARADQLVERRSRNASELDRPGDARSEEHTSELQSLMRITYDVCCLKKIKKTITRKNKKTKQNAKCTVSLRLMYSITPIHIRLSSP